MSLHSPQPPVPGDPRSRGPRPGPGWRDGAWALLAGVMAGGTAIQLGGLAVVAATDPDVVLTTGALLLAFVVTVVWLMTAFWVTVGAWRRTVWGCPFEHLESTPPVRRCPRHRLVRAADGRSGGPPPAPDDLRADPDP